MVPVLITLLEDCIVPEFVKRLEELIVPVLLNNPEFITLLERVMSWKFPPDTIDVPLNFKSYSTSRLYATAS
jgi:hypothetical protein